ncbi:MAG: secretin N-terminal domain-containing protein [Microcystaceae cyanobacterium]
MKSFYYPLMVSGSLLAILSGSPSQAKEAHPFVPSTANLPATANIPEMIVIDSSGEATISGQVLDGYQTPSWEKSSEKTALIPSASITKQDLSSQSFLNFPDSTSLTPPSFLAQAQPDILVPQPEIIIDNETGNGQDLLTPQAPAAPILPRAIAPPVGDMAVSNINATADRITLGTNVIIPRLVLQDAPASKVLEVLAEYAGLNMVYNTATGEEGGEGGGDATISLNFTNESLEDVFNTVLIVSGLQANRRGRTIYVGANLPPEALNLISRTIRLNQVKSFNAGTFLASQGAEFQRLVTQTEDITDPLTGRVIGRREVPANLEAIQAAQEGGTGAPLLLTGLRVSTDDRLNSITMVGEPRQVAIATSLLTQLDARRRQVAINVKVVDINLDNVQDFSSSFSFGVNDSFFVQDNGSATLRFGTSSPVRGIDLDSDIGRVTNPPVIENPLAEGGNILFDINDRQVITVPRFSNSVDTDDLNFFPSGIGVSNSNNPFATGISEFSITETTLDLTEEIPAFFQNPRKFLALIETEIESGNAKILTDPTLVVQEGQEATVKLTQKVIESVDTSVDPLSGVRTTTPVLADAGLTLVVNVDKVDDNGFVNLSVSPTVAAVGAQQEFDSGDGTINVLNLLNRRELTSGLVRLRDGQTLILSGVIQESDRSVSSKVPILGDIPILGALFRSQSDETERTEVVIVVTPQIMDDNAQFGYNYAPGREAADVLRRRGYQIPSQ